MATRKVGRTARRDFLSDHPNRILAFTEWCVLNNISERTGRRIVQRGEVKVTQLSPKRIGISIENNARWQQARERA